MKKIKLIFVTLVVVVLIVIGTSLAKSNQETNQAPKNTTSERSEVIATTCQTPKQDDETVKANLQISKDGKTVSYSGQTGKTALEILNLLTDVKSEESSFGPMIKSINCVDQTDKEFWTYTVDGQIANVGAHEFQTKDGQKIQWQLKGM